MIITALQPIMIEVPPHDAPPHSSWKAEAGLHIFVRLDTAAGPIGWGNCFAYRQPNAVCAAVENLARLLVGRQFGSPGELLTDLERVADFRNAHERFAAAGIELACWDVFGKTRNQPVYALLDPNASASPRSFIPAYASLPRYDTPADVAAAASMAVQRGFKALKLHQTDVNSVRAAREAIGSEIALMLDVNGAWQTDEAIDRCRELEPFDLRWVEEPITPLDDHAGLAHLRSNVSIAIAAGENESEPAAYQHLIDQRSVDVVQPSLLKVGGLQRFIEIAALVEAAGATLMPHVYYFGPGLAASLHFAAICNRVEWLEIPFVDLVDSIMIGPCELDRGCLIVPKAPGLGADPDPRWLQRFAC